MKDEKNITPFYASFIRLCAKENKSPTAVAKIAGISSGAPTAWKKGAVPKPEQRKLLCAFFGVTDEELLGYEKTPDDTQADGLKSTRYYELNDENKALVDQMIEKLLKSQYSE